jgi:hypothetical protein
LQQVLADNPAIEVATDVPPFKFAQWDGKLLREIPRPRVKPGATLLALSSSHLMRKSGSQQTRRWRKPDSNSRSHMRLPPFRHRLSETRRRTQKPIIRGFKRKAPPRHRAPLSVTDVAARRSAALAPRGLQRQHCAWDPKISWIPGIQGSIPEPQRAEDLPASLRQQ